MSISFDSVLGIHPQALLIRARRAELLASNLAHADTPGYKARDIDFKAALNASMQSSSVNAISPDLGDSSASVDGLMTNNKNYLSLPAEDRLSISPLGMQTQYRVPTHASLDGNTVDSQLEKSAFAENALHYEAGLTFLSGKFKGLLMAIKGQ